MTCTFLTTCPLYFLWNGYGENKEFSFPPISLFACWRERSNILNQGPTMGKKDGKEVAKPFYSFLNSEFLSNTDGYLKNRNKKIKKIY